MCHCDECGQAIPEDHQVSEKEWQGDGFNGCFVFILTGYNCPGCGHMEGF